MRILTVYNKHRSGGGSDVVASRTVELLRARGHVVEEFVRDSQVLVGKPTGRIRAFSSGLYARSALRQFQVAVERFRPDVVHAHELYPLITPWIFVTLKRMGIPSVMTCHDYRMTCPVHTHFRKGHVCTECVNATEWSCVAHNCGQAIGISLAYALRNAVARKSNLYSHADLFVTPSRFARSWLVEQGGVAPARIAAAGNPVRAPSSVEAYFPERRPAIGFIGRLTKEKGISVLMEAATLTGLPFHLAGGGDLSLLDGRPPNVTALGALEGEDAVNSFYSGIRLLVIPSLWFETFGMVMFEARSRGIPVVCSDIGALSELTRHGVDGLLFRVGDAADLAANVMRLWNDPTLCRSVGEAGRRSVERFSEESYCARLEQIYQRLAGGGHFAEHELPHYEILA